MNAAIDWLATAVPWWGKVLLLLAGLKFPTLGLVYLILDGRFHYTASLDRLKRESPDWILADMLGLKRGLGVPAHRAMGVALMAGSAWALYDVYARDGRGHGAPFTGWWLYVLMPVVLVIIAAGITVKNLLWKPTRRGQGRVAFL